MFVFLNKMNIMLCKIKAFLQIFYLSFFMFIICSEDGSPSGVLKAFGLNPTAKRWRCR